MNHKFTNCLIFLFKILKDNKDFFIDVNMIMNVVKNDTNKRWVIHNLNQQKMGNLWLLENNFFEEEG